MNLNQKVRVLRKFGNQLINEHEHHSWEISAFGAPSEVWELIAKGTHERVISLMSQLGLTVEEFNEEASRQIHLEGQFTEEEPPMAYYETMMVAEHFG